jgi:hypothetical protein
VHSWTIYTVLKGLAEKLISKDLGGRDTPLIYHNMLDISQKRREDSSTDQKTPSPKSDTRRQSAGCCRNHVTLHLAIRLEPPFARVPRWNLEWTNLWVKRGCQINYTGEEHISFCKNEYLTAAGVGVGQRPNQFPVNLVNRSSRFPTWHQFYPGLQSPGSAATFR